MRTAMPPAERYSIGAPHRSIAACSGTCLASEAQGTKQSGEARDKHIAPEGFRELRSLIVLSTISFDKEMVPTE